jgi:hypothetical protein
VEWLKGGDIMAEVILFEHANFHGAHKHLFTSETNLDASSFKGLTSSIVIISGTWEFYRGWDYEGLEARLGPGLYGYVGNYGITNDALSSVQLVGIEAGSPEGHGAELGMV